jgi:hypothetical protein
VEVDADTAAVAFEVPGIVTAATTAKIPVAASAPAPAAAVKRFNLVSARSRSWVV